MMCSLFHPGLLLIIFGLLIPFFQGFKRTLFILSVPCISLFTIWSMSFGNDCTVQYLDYELILINLDTLSRLFSTVFVITVFTVAFFVANKQVQLNYLLHMYTPVLLYPWYWQEI